MNLNLIKNHFPLFVPPVELPMQMWISGGIFGIDRSRDERTVHTSNGDYSYNPLQNHVGIDLDAPEGSPVFSARKGQIMNIASISGDQDNQWIAMRHTYEGGMAFTTRYLHLREVVVSERDTVEHGHLIGFTGSKNHLHFEIHIIMNTDNLKKDWYRINIEPVDPTPYLYPWEKIYYERILNIVPSTQSPTPIQEAGMLRIKGIPMFRVKQNNINYYIPLYHLDSGDRCLVKMLYRAFVCDIDRVRLASRGSLFFGDRKIITAARILK